MVSDTFEVLITTLSPAHMVDGTAFSKMQVAGRRYGLLYGG